MGMLKLPVCEVSVLYKEVELLLLLWETLMVTIAIILLVSALRSLTMVTIFVCLCAMLAKCLVEVLKAFPDAFVNSDKKKNFCAEVRWQ